MDNTYCVYKLTSPDGKVYIGVTKHGDNPNKRWQNGDKYSECPSIRDAIATYGWDNFSKEILDNFLSKDEACAEEQYWISYYRSNNAEYGYNLASGGFEGYRHAASTKEKVSKSHTGMKLSAETKDKLRQIALSRPPMSKETKAKISAANLGHVITESDRATRSSRLAGHTVSDATRQNISNALKGKSTRSRRVICIETGEIFESAREASLHYGKAKGSLTSCIFSNKRFCGMHWKYLDEMGDYRMSISENNVRAGIVLPKELKAKLEELAKTENRSLNNYIVTVLQNHVNKQ